jgi:hypothetical protein
VVSTNRNTSEFEQAMDRLDREVRDGLKHGFFDLTVACEMVRGRKRRLIIKAGKSHVYTIPEDELG